MTTINTSNVVDITNPVEPIALAREMVNRAIGCKAAIAVLVKDDGSIWYDCSGHEVAYILWALEKIRYDLMSHADDED